MPTQLSTGEQQRVGIARAVVGKPKILLADEPTGNLDPQLARSIMKLFSQFNELGTTVIIASHDIGLIESMQMPTVNLREGRIAKAAGAWDVSEAKPKTRRATKSSRRQWPAPKRRFSWFFADHLRAVSETFKFVSLKLGSSLFVWLLVGIALALPAALRLTQLNFVALDDGWQGRPGLSVYFQVTADTADIAAVQTLLQQNTSMIEVRLTDADQALQEFMAASADSKSLTTALSTLSANPLPASLQVAVSNQVTTEQLAALRRQLLQQAAVDDVVIEFTWLERLRSLTQLVERLGWILEVYLP